MNTRRFTNIVALAALAITVASSFAVTRAVAADAPSPTATSSLIGSWTVDLRPTPSSPAYLKKLVITAVDGTRIEGHFYDGSPLQAGRINTTSGPVPCFAFVTDPGEGAYNSAGRQVGPDRLEGMTLSTSRGFLLAWTAVRDAAR